MVKKVHTVKQPIIKTLDQKHKTTHFHFTFFFFSSIKYTFTYNHTILTLNLLLGPSSSQNRYFFTDLGSAQNLTYHNNTIEVPVYPLPKIGGEHSLHLLPNIKSKNGM